MGRCDWQARADWVGGWAEATAQAQEATMSSKTAKQAEQQAQEARADGWWWDELVAKAEREAWAEKIFKDQEAWEVQAWEEKLDQEAWEGVIRS